jgi:DNA-binding FadR family transcriptional regulator
MVVTPQEIFVRERSQPDRVLRRIMRAILDGAYGPGARLPAERELVSQLGASRVSVREAFRRLQDWRVIVTRAGSGATVLPRRFWTGNALSSVFLHGLAGDDVETLQPLVADGFSLRRSQVLAFMSRAAGRVRPGDLDPVRDLVARAWALRADADAFYWTDWEVVPRVLELAQMFPSLWVLNSLAECYLGVMMTVIQTIDVPASYVPAHRAVFDAQERGDADGARRHMAAYLDDLDEVIVAVLPPKLQERFRADAEVKTDAGTDAKQGRMECETRGRQGSREEPAERT